MRNKWRNLCENQNDQILLAGSMMAVAKMLYHNNLTEKEFDNILNHNGRDLLNQVIFISENIQDGILFQMKLITMKTK